MVSADNSGKQAVVISDYNRHGADLSSLEFLRAEDTLAELKVWEAAAATAAAIPYFQPFEHQRSGRTFYDGALYHNNPSEVARRESHLLWPDMENHQPDIFLSIGTGQKERDIENQKNEYYKDVQSGKMYTLMQSFL